MTIKKRVLILALIILLSSFFGGCSDDVSLQTIQYKGYLMVGYYPGSYLNEPVINVIEYFARELGIEVAYKTENKETWQADLHNGEIDLMIDETNDIDIVSEVIFTSKVLFIKSQNSDLVNGGLVGVMDVGMARDASEAVSGFHNGEYIYYGQSQILIQDFKSGYLQGMILGEYDFLTKGKGNLNDYQYDTINHRDVHMIFDVDNSGLANEFNSRLKILKDTGMLHSLLYN